MSCSIVLLVVRSTIKNQKYIRKFKTVRNNRRHRGISVPKRVFPYNTLLIFLKFSPETPFLFWSHGFNINKSKLHLNGTLNLYLGSNFFISGVRLYHLRIYSFTYSNVRYCYIAFSRKLLNLLPFIFFYQTSNPRIVKGNSTLTS